MEHEAYGYSWAEIGAARDAVRLATHFGCLIAVVRRDTPKGWEYRTINPGIESDVWTRVGTAYPTGRYHGTDVSLPA